MKFERMLPPLSLSMSSSSPNSAAVRVDKATSDFLMAPDWTMNMEICDSVNANHGIAKEVVKAVKKRLQQKNPRVQMLTLTLLETLVKNCGDHIHFLISERKVLDEMIKIVKKRTDLQVRIKILVLLDSWQEAFGGPGGKHSLYYWAYDELRRSGVQFPQRSLDTVPIITPPVTSPSTRTPPALLGLPNNTTTALDVATGSDGQGLSLSEMGSIRNAVEVLADMLQAINPNDRMSVKDEVIVDLVNRCRANQKRLVQMLGTTLDEELLGQGLELNDTLQALLAKHDAIASGLPIPAHLMSTASFHPNEPSTSNLKPNVLTPEDSILSTNAKPTMNGRAVEENEEEDEFAQLAKRHSVQAKSEDIASSSSSNGPPFSASSVPDSILSNALVPVDSPPPVKANKEQDMVDFLSIVLSTSLTTEEEPSPQTPNPAPAQNYPVNNSQPTFSSYVVPWAQSQPQPQQQQPIYYPQQSFAYPPPPWAPTPGYVSGQNMMTAQQTIPVPDGPQSFYSYQNQQQPLNTGIESLQQSNSFQSPQSINQLGSLTQQRTVNSSPMSVGPVPGVAVGGPAAVSSPRGQQKSNYVPSYRLFEDLNVFGSVEGGKMRSGPYSSASGSSSQSLVGGRR
ncbi:hypothetical protein V2J09_007050 [Rumex salicifolius]